MRKFIIRILLLFAVYFILDTSISKFLQFFRPEDYRAHIESKYEFIREKKDFDILILGDSHVADALNPKIFEDLENVSAFNFGVYHASPFEVYHLTRYLVDIKSIDPGTVILGTNPLMFCHPLEAGNYTPILIKNPYRNFRLYYESNSNTLIYFSSVAREKYLFKSMFRKFFGEEPDMYRNIAFIYHGYLGNISHHQDNMEFPDNFADQQQNPAQIEYFIKTIKYLKSIGKQVIMVNPPIYKDYLSEYMKTRVYSDFSNQLKKISEDFSVPFFNPEDLELPDKLTSVDYLNAEHLNNMGAGKFTAAFCSYLKENFTLNTGKP